MKLIMDFENDPVLIVIPKSCIPISYRGSLAPYILNPGPKLVQLLGPVLSCNEWEFPVYRPFPRIAARELLNILKYALAYISHHHRLFLDDETLTSLLRDIMRHAKQVWPQYARRGHHSRAFGESLTIFCLNDTRCTKCPDFWKTFITYEQGALQTHANRNELRMERSDEPEHLTPDAFVVGQVRNIIDYATSSLNIITSSNEDAVDSERVRKYFADELKDSHLDWLGGWINSEDFVDEIITIFQECSPVTIFFDISDEYYKQYHIDDRHRAVLDLKRRTATDASLDEDRNECTICLEVLAKGDEVCDTSCNHTYHASCILSWFWNSATCPLDRTDL